VTKRRQLSPGRVVGGQAFTRGHLYQLLSNPIYVGEVAHKAAGYAGRQRTVMASDPNSKATPSYGMGLPLWLWATRRLAMLGFSQTFSSRSKRGARGLGAPVPIANQIRTYW
jgi:hypothetical protein